MYINITDSESGNNKGSSKQLVHYLDKENRLFDSLKPEQWFNGTSNAVPSHEVGSKLDNNVAKLGRDDAKFFLINISPSQKEIGWLKSQYGEDGAKEMLKTFAIDIMDEYAKNFNRPGVKSNIDFDDTRTPKSVYEFLQLDQSQTGDDAVSDEEWQKHLR